MSDRCAELGIEHGDAHDRGDFGIAMDIADPDGTVLRFVAGAHTGPPGAFAGIEFGSGPPIIYDQVSSRGESHPPALAEPYVTVSCHTAPTGRPWFWGSRCQCAKSLGPR